MLTSVLRNIFRVNLAVKKTERCLIFADKPTLQEEIEPSEAERRSMLKCIAFLASEVGKSFAKEVIFYEFPAVGSHGVEPPRKLWEIAFGKRAVSALKEKRILDPILKKTAGESEIREAGSILQKFKKDSVDAVVALSNFSTSHTRFRDFLTRICGTRYASMPLFEVSMFEGPMNVDWRSLDRLTKAVADKVNTAERIEIATDNGSSLSFSIKGRKALADTGILTRSGSFGNLPAGEVYLAPVEGTAQGKLVLEWAPTRELKSSVILTIKDGFVKDISGAEVYADQLRKKLSERKENCNIAELGIGTNNRARRPDNILESEKILGTIHIALGDNSSFGGTTITPFHQDFVFFRPTVILVRKDKGRTALMKQGKLQVIV
jgi:aminopeptidase